MEKLSEALSLQAGRRVELYSVEEHSMRVHVIAIRLRTPATVTLPSSDT